MACVDIDRARAAFSALKDFFASHPKGPLGGEEVRNLAHLCDEAASSVNDSECRYAVRKIAGYSELLSRADPAAPGADFVRLRVQNALASFRSYLKDMEGAGR